MSEELSELKRAYRRASIGLAVAAVVWTAAFFVSRERGWTEVNVVIPVVAAALSALCYARYRKVE
jgi:hypothetical protein